MSMTLNEYQDFAQRTSNHEINTLVDGVMGLCGEAGECIDIVKKHLNQGHPMDVKKLAEEMGDVLWYLAELASALGLKLEDIAHDNIEKLFKRYPDGFSPERSIHREV